MRDGGERFGKYATHLRAIFFCFVSALLFLLVAYLDYVTGTEISLSIFYLIPILVVTWYTGLVAAVLVSIMGAILVYLTDITIGEANYSSPAVAYWDTAVRLGFFLTVSLAIASLHRSMKLLKSRAEELANAYHTLDETRKEQILMRDHLLSHVSHELRTPLAAIHQFVTLVSDGVAGDLTPQQKEFLGVAVRNVKQLDRMIADLLDSTRAEAGKLRLTRKDISIAGMVEETVEVFNFAAATKSLHLSAKTEPNLPLVNADPIRLHQVLTNFLDNAMKYTPAGGSILIRAGTWTGKPGYLHVSVSDTGPGIPMEAQKMLFLRFSQVGNEADTASRKGLGLGLYISSEIVKLHGGEIWADSETGKGSVFHFAVPFKLEA